MNKVPSNKIPERDEGRNESKGTHCKIHWRNLFGSYCLYYLQAKGSKKKQKKAYEACIRQVLDISLTYLVKR